MGAKIKLLTTYYLQTDDQTERTNQILEIYLQHYMDYSQKKMGYSCYQWPSWRLTTDK